MITITPRIRLSYCQEICDWYFGFVCPLKLLSCYARELEILVSLYSLAFGNKKRKDLLGNHDTHGSFSIFRFGNTWESGTVTLVTTIPAITLLFDLHLLSWCDFLFNVYSEFVKLLLIKEVEHTGLFNLDIENNDICVFFSILDLVIHMN